MLNQSQDEKTIGSLALPTIPFLLGNKNLKSIGLAFIILIITEQFLKKLIFVVDTLISLKKVLKLKKILKI